MSESGADKPVVQIVDDKSENLKILMKILTEQGCEVRTSINGALALKSIRTDPPDLILLDIMMPGMDGFEVCGQLKADERTRDIPVIFISALHETVDKIRAFSIGGVDYVTKPFQEEEVLARVSTHLSLRKAQQRLELQNRHLQEEIAERQRIEDILNATGKMAKVGGWELDAETLEVTWTEQIYRIHEVPRDYKPTSQEAIDFFHPEDRDMLSDAIRRALESGEPYDMETRFITAKGRHLRTRTICEPVLAGGKVTKLKGTFQDITDYKQAREALMASESRFRELFDNMSSGVAVYEAAENGQDFIFRDFNRAGERIDDVRKEDIIGKSVSEIFPGIRDFGLSDVFRRVWQTGEPEHFPVSFYLDDRIAGWRENYVYKLHSGEIVAVYDDVTEREQTREALQTEYERFVTVMDALDAVVYVSDLETCELLFVNAALRTMFGNRIGEKCWAVLQSRQTGPCPFCTNDKLTDADGKPAAPYVWEFQNTNDDQWYQCRDQAIRWTDGRLVRLEIATNINDIKQAGEQIQRAREEAERANQAKSSFLANMSHELRTPLNAILGFSQAMRNKGGLSPEYQENLDIIHQRGEDLLALINRMIDIARIEDAPAAERIDAVLKELQQGDGDQKSDVVRQLETSKFAASLTELSSGLLADLEQAILNVDVGQIYRLIERIRAQDAALADALKESIDNFEYETILTLIK